MPKKVPKTKIENKNSFSRTKRSLKWLVGFCLLVILASSLAWIFRADKPAYKVTGTDGLTEKQLDALSEQSKYQSLDLRVASLAIYKGAQLTVNDDLGVIGGVHQKVISFPVYSAGLVEKGLMTLPITPPPPTGYPVIILLHGYLDPRRYSTLKAYLPQMEYFSQHGFAVVKPDLRGNGMSQNAGRPEGAYYSMAYNVDTLSLLASIEKTGYLDSSNVSEWGHSMGAYIALRAAVLAPEIKNVILLSGPVGNIRDMYTSYIAPSDRSNPVAFLIRSDQLSENGTPVSNPSYWYNVSPLNFLKQSKAKLQIHVGLLDRTVLPRFSDELDAALTKDNIAHEYYAYPDGDHGLGPQMPVVLSRSLSLLQSKD